MAKSIFILKEGNVTEPTLIYLFSRIDGNRFKYSTGQKVIPDIWDNTTHRVKLSGLKGKDLDNANSINLVLENYDRAFKQVNDSLALNGLPETIATFRNGLDKRLLKEKKDPATFEYLQAGSTFTDFVNHQIKTSTVKIGTKKVYNDLLTHINGYTKNRKLEFQSVDMRFYAGFTHYLTTKTVKNRKKVENGEKKEDVQYLSLNTVGKYIQTLKALMSSAFDKGLHTQLDFKKSTFKAIKEETVKIYLTEKEIQKLKQLENLPTSHERVRDMFIISCRTGLRYSDIEKLNSDNFIKNDTQIKIHTIKTGTDVVVPLHEDVREIWEKYNHQLPKVDVNQVFNRYLKDLGKDAKIITPTPIQSTIGGELKRDTVPKYKLMTTHTGRRTFATLAFLAEVPSISIMKITGHKTEAAFMKYIKISPDENADKLMQHPFFKPKLKVV